MNAIKQIIIIIVVTSILLINGYLLITNQQNPPENNPEIEVSIFIWDFESNLGNNTTLKMVYENQTFKIYDREKTINFTVDNIPVTIRFIFENRENGSIEEIRTALNLEGVHSLNDDVVFQREGEGCLVRYTYEITEE